jgi:hypothetical protein
MQAINSFVNATQKTLTIADWIPVANCWNACYALIQRHKYASILKLRQIFQLSATKKSRGIFL